MRRKIIKQGIGGNTIFLPIKWVRKQHLKPGDEVNITEKERNLIISGSGRPEKKVKNIQLKKIDSQAHFRSIVASAYKQGYHIINVQAEELPSLQTLNSISNTFTGMELTKQTANEATFQVFLEDNAKETKVLIEKMFHMVLLIAEELTTYAYEEIEQMVTINIRKLRDHCLRSIHSQQYEHHKSFDYYDLVTILEKIATHFNYLAAQLQKKENKLVMELTTHFRKTYTVYLKADFKTTNKWWNEHKKLAEKKLEPTSLEKLTKKELAVVPHYYHITMLIRQLLSRMLAVHN